MFKVIFFMMMSLAFNASAADPVQNKAPEVTSPTSPQNKPSPCASKEACLNDPNCLCWCSQICNWRKKTADDHPFYVENDPYGKFCYCKQWDYDHYKDNCIDGKNIKEPKGAK